MDAATQAAINAAAAAAPEPSVFPATVPGRRVHIDGDFLAYQASGKEDTGEGEARIDLLQRINRFRLWAGAQYATIHLTCRASDKGGRYTIATVKGYQSNRKGHHPKNWEFLRNFMEKQAQYIGKVDHFVVWTDREADDAIAFEVARAPGDVVCMKDKDSRMNNALHINWDRPYIMVNNLQDDYEVVGEDDLVYGRKWFYLQMCMGDGVDAIPGLEMMPYYTAKGAASFKKCGEVGAEEILAGVDNADDAFLAVARAYLGYYGDTWAERFAEQAALLWMRRDAQATPHDFVRYINPTLAGYAKVAQAALALSQRVEVARAEVESIRSQGNP